MAKTSTRTFGEIVAVGSVVLSLIFVGLEFRQSAIASRAEAFQELGIATSNLLVIASADDELREALNRASSGEESISSMSEEELWRATQWAQGTLRLYETVYLQVELGLLEPEALNYLGFEGYRQLPWLKNLWPKLTPFLSSSFREYVETSWEQD